MKLRYIAHFYKSLSLPTFIAYPLLSLRFKPEANSESPLKRTRRSSVSVGFNRLQLLARHLSGGRDNIPGLVIDGTVATLNRPTPQIFECTTPTLTQNYNQK